MALVSDKIVDLHLVSPGCSTQCFPFYTYNEDGTNRRENITDWALEQFRIHQEDKSITKWEIFHYIYALLHHPAYRERYAANLNAIAAHSLHARLQKIRRSWQAFS